MTALERFTQSAYNFMKYFRHQYPAPEARKEEHRDLQAAGPGVQQAQAAWRDGAHGAGQGDPDPAAQEPAGGHGWKRRGQLQEGEGGLLPGAGQPRRAAQAVPLPHR